MKKILLVEDEPMLSNLLRQRLEKENFKVTAAHDGNEAIKFLKQEKPDLILFGYYFAQNVRLRDNGDDKERSDPPGDTRRRDFQLGSEQRHREGAKPRGNRVFRKGQSFY